LFVFGRKDNIKREPSGGGGGGVGGAGTTGGKNICSGFTGESEK